MKALWWKQPYGQLMLHGKIETRTWSTDYRGPVLICTSKTPYTERGLMDIAGAENYKKIKELFRGQGLYNGHAIAVGELVDCRPLYESERAKPPHTVDDITLTYVKELLARTLYGHFYVNVRLIHPFPMKGGLGWRDVTPEQQHKIHYL